MDANLSTGEALKLSAFMGLAPNAWISLGACADTILTYC